MKDRGAQHLSELLTDSCDEEKDSFRFVFLNSVWGGLGEVLGVFLCVLCALGGILHALVCSSRKLKCT